MFVVNSGVLVLGLKWRISGPRTGPSSMYIYEEVWRNYRTLVTFDCVLFTGSQSREREWSGESSPRSQLGHVASDMQYVMCAAEWLLLVCFWLVCTACYIYMHSFIYLTSSCCADVCPVIADWHPSTLECKDITKRVKCMQYRGIVCVCVCVCGCPPPCVCLCVLARSAALTLRRTFIC